MIKIYATIAIALVLAGLSWYAKSQTERAALAEAQVKSYTIALEIQNQAVLDFEEDLANREIERQAAADNAARWRHKWQEAKRDPIVKKWASVPLPGPVRVRVCEYARCDHGGETESGPFEKRNLDAIVRDRGERGPS